MIPIVVPWRGAVSAYANVSIGKVITAALDKLRHLNIVPNAARAVVLHDSDITDQSEMDDWVMRVVDVGTRVEDVGSL